MPAHKKEFDARWIRIEQQLPEPGVQVWVYSQGTVSTGIRCDRLFQGRIVWWDDKRDITHWQRMILPTPPHK